MNHIYGLFEVTDGIYQVRGYDMSNITFVRGDSGWIVFDPLMTVECAQAAKALVDEELGELPVRAVIYSHSHVDHFGGVCGIVDEEDVTSGAVTIIAPEGFEEHAVSENVYAGTAWVVVPRISTAPLWNQAKPDRSPSASAWAGLKAPCPTSAQPTPSQKPVKPAPSMA